MLSKRLEKFIGALGMTIHAFEGSIGVANTTIRKAIENDKGIGSKILEKIFAEYPQLSFDWLIGGRGEMLVRTETISPTLKEVLPAYQPANGSFPKLKNNKIVPILDARAAAGDPFIFDHPDYFRKLESFTFPGFMFPPGNYASIQVRGESMAETLFPGDFVLGRELEHLSQLKSGDIYIVIYQEDHRPHFVVKRCFYYLGDDDMELKSDNPLEKQRDTNLPVSSIMKLYHVVARFTMTIGKGNDNVIQRFERFEGRLKDFEDRFD